MESFKQFLETASINGLIHISSTRRCTRLFWITLLTMGLIVSSVLIWESFQSWEDNPVRTTTRTVAMKKIKFPKLTVCPPKNTFTDLNYDLMLAENVTLTDETKNELFEYAVALIDEHFYMDPWDKMHEENRFHNWYTGFTSMYHEPGSEGNFYRYTISTSASSGLITTQYFGENYNPSLVEKKLYYRIEVLPPQSIVDNENVTLHFKIENLNLQVQNDATGFGTGKIITSLPIDKDLDSFEKKITPPGRIQFLDSFRFINDKDINEANLKLMPGFRFSWHYTGVDFNPDPYINIINTTKYEYTLSINEIPYITVQHQNFIREAFSKTLGICNNIFIFRFLNMLDEASLDHSSLWKHVKAVRSEYRNRNSAHKNKCLPHKVFLPNEERETLLNNLQDHLRVSNPTDEIKSLPTSTIEEGGKMFVYLNSCPALHWQNFYHHLLFEKKNSEIILSVLNAMKNSRTKGSRAVANKVLGRLADNLGFQYKIFSNETTWDNSIATVKG